VAHVVEKRCPAGVCRNLLHYQIDPDKCKGCTMCAKNCPVGAISGAVKGAHTIDQSKCIKCGLCQTNCRFDAITKR
jgi:NADP-reducing hydrogenase subunit HndC